MSMYAEVSHLELARRLMQLREAAGLKQAELARRMTWSPAVLSRVESGERPLAPDELDLLLRNIPIPGAASLRMAMQRQWVVLPRPGLDHPDQDLLWEAEQVARELEERRQDPQVRTAFERRLAGLSTELRAASGLLLKRDYQIAFIGSIGVGKSTAICRLTGLELPGDDGGPPTPVLEAGGGGITLCEVHLRTGPSYGIIIEPRSDEDVRVDVADFADYLMSAASARPEDTDSAEGDQQGVSKEVERAIRNMAGLRIRREKRPDGKRASHDDARLLAREQSSARELVVEILSRMALHRRDRRDTWYDPASGKTPLAWVKDTFEQVNNGRHLEFTLPRRIEVVVPSTLLGLTDLTVRIVDTKGIDRTATRADLEAHLDDPHTLALLCSGFYDAPAAATQLLLTRAREAGIRSLETHAALLVLSKTGEALEMKDEAGIRVETVEEGYELKGEQIELALQPLHMSALQTGFFNARQESPERLRAFLSDRLAASRRSSGAALATVVHSARAILANAEREAAQEVLRDAAQVLRTWTSQHARLAPADVHVQDSLLSELAHAYASTIRATIRREGEWINLSYSHHLGYGARRVAAMALGRVVDGFSEVCRTLHGSENYREAQELIGQAERTLVAAYDELLRKVQLMGQASYRDALKLDVTFWESLGSEAGKGYKGRVVNRNAEWFAGEQRKTLETELWALIDREWQSALANVNALLEVDEH